MDAHTLELLEFDKVRVILAGYASTSLGEELARQVSPIQDIERIRHDLGLVSEMVEALMANQAPPFGGVHPGGGSFRLRPLGYGSGASVDPRLCQ